MAWAGSKAGVTYTYGTQAADCPNGALTKPHAVVTAGSNTYCYDQNGNMNRRVIGGANGITYNLTYDPENRLTGVTWTENSVPKSVGYIYDSDGNRVKSIDAYQNLAAGVTLTSTVSLTYPDVVTNGETWATTSNREFAYTPSGLNYVQLDLGAVYPVDKVMVWHFATDGRTYYKTKTQVSENGTTWHTVFDSDVSGTYQETAQGKAHSFPLRNVRYVRDYLNGSTANPGNHWVEIEVWGKASVAYVGSHFEWKGSPTTMVKYYSAGGQRVAMRQGSNLLYLLGDHLGSTSLTVDPISAGKVTELRYKAWGETRHPDGNTATTYRYTGQRQESSIGLYYYGARWYDPYLGRFAQADTIVPLESQGVQAWDRYAGMNNNPIKYNDPTGHDVGAPGKDASSSASKTVILIACGVGDGPCGYNTKTMRPAYDYAVENGHQVYFYDPDSVTYNSAHAKYDMAQDMSTKIQSNANNDIYIVGYSAGADASVLAAEMSGYSNDIKGIGLIDPYLKYQDVNGDKQELWSQANAIPSNGISLALADSPKDETTVSIPGAVVPNRPFEYGHERMGRDTNVFNFIFDNIVR